MYNEKKNTAAAWWIVTIEDVYDHVSNPHKATDNITILYLLIFIFSYGRLWTERQQAWPEFIVLADHVSNPHKATDNITVLYLSIFVFSYGRLWTERQQAWPEFIVLADHVSNPHKATDNITVLCLLIFIFSYGRLWTERQQAWPEFVVLAVLTRKQLWSVRTVPQHSHFARAPTSRTDYNAICTSGHSLLDRAPAQLHASRQRTTR